MPKNAPAPNATAGEQKTKPKLPMKTILVIAGVLLLEGGTIGVFVAMKDGPKASDASDPIADTTETANAQMAEIPLVESMQVDNYTQGRTRLLVTLEVTAKVKKDKQEKIGPLVIEHATEIRDRIRTLVSSARPEDITDPKLQIIKREIKVNVERIIGQEDCIEEILVPSLQSLTID